MCRCLPSTGFSRQFIRGLSERHNIALSVDAPILTFERDEWFDFYLNGLPDWSEQHWPFEVVTAGRATQLRFTLERFKTKVHSVQLNDSFDRLTVNVLDAHRRNHVL